jgi:ribosomal protein S18 acetylase RimI-like enzyme
MPDFRCVPACDLEPAQLHAAFTNAFSDYLIGPFSLPPEQWPRFLARQGIALAHSRVALGPQGILAFALTAPRADQASWRLGTMGALPAARGSGAAPALLDEFIARAQAHGQARVELECFAQNTRALRLYRSRGFEAVASLWGYQREAAEIGGPGSDAGVQGVTLDEAWAWIEHVSRRRRDLPFQVTPASLRAQPLVLQAWRCGDAQLVAAESAPGQFTVLSLLDETAAQEGAERLLRHLLQRAPAPGLAVPQLQRDDLGGLALQRLGARKLPLHQLLMHKPL